MTTHTTSKAELARQAWTLMFDFFVQTVPERSECMGRRGLSPNDLRALSSMAGTDGRTMRSLAAEWGCDASNVTLIVDRLERLGLAQRAPMPGDRRVRLATLTPKGMRMHAELVDEFHSPPASLMALSKTELETLRRVLRRIPAPPSAA